MDSKIINTLSVLVFILVSSSVIAQSSSEKAAAYYFEAEKSYVDSNYKTSLDLLKKCFEFNQGSNARIESLKVKIYYAQKEFKKAKIALSKFYNYPAKTALKKQMSSYIVRVDSELEKLIQQEKEDARRKELKRKRKIKEENDLWNQVSREQSPYSLDRYLNKYPNGRYVTRAISQKEELMGLRENRINEIFSEITNGYYIVGGTRKVKIQFKRVNNEMGFFLMSKEPEWETVTQYVTGDFDGKKNPYWYIKKNTSKNTDPRIFTFVDNFKKRYHKNMDGKRFSTPLEHQWIGGEYKPSNHSISNHGFAIFGVYKRDNRGLSIRITDSFGFVKNPWWEYSLELNFNFRDSGKIFNEFIIRRAEKYYQAIVGNPKTKTAMKFFPTLGKKTDILKFKYDGSSKYIPSLPSQQIILTIDGTEFYFYKRSGNISNSGFTLDYIINNIETFRNFFENNKHYLVKQ